MFDPYWLAKGNKFSCGREEISLPLSGVFSVLGDFYSTTLPLLLVWNLQLPRRQKLALYSLFALGFMYDPQAVTISCIRLTISSSVVAAGIVRTILLNKVINGTYDPIWYLWVYYIWAVIELTLAIVAASAPALKPFLRRFLIDPITSRSGHGTPRYGYGYTISSGGYAKGSQAGSRNSRVDSRQRFRDTKEVDVEERRLEEIPESPDFDGSTIGTAVPFSPPVRSGPGNEYEMTDKPRARGHSPSGIEMHTTYEVTSEVANDDNSPQQPDNVRDGPFIPSQGRAMGAGSPKSKSPGAGRSRGDSGASSIGNTTLDTASWPPEQVPWDPAERVKFYARQTSN